MLIVAEFLPIGEGTAVEIERLVVDVPEAVFIHLDFDAVPGAAHQGALVEDDNVIGKGEGLVLFDASGLDLVVFGEGEDVVADDIFFAVVLVEAAGFGAVNDVIFHMDSGGAFVGVESPAAVAPGVDIVHDVVADGGTFGGAQGVDAAHIAEDAPADMVDMIKVDLIAFGEAFGIAPAPADRNPGVAEIGDFVVDNAVVGAVADPDSDGAGVDMAAVADDAIFDGVVMGAFIEVGGDAAFANPDSASAEIVDIAVGDGTVLAAFTEPEAVFADVGELAAVEVNILGAVEHDRGFDGVGGLGGFETGRGKQVSGAGEVKTAELDILDEAFILGFAFDDDDVFDDGGDELGGFDALAGQGDIGEQAGAIEEPFAGGIEGGAEIFEVVAVVLEPGVPGFHAAAFGGDGVVVGIERGEEAAGDIPFVVDHHGDIVEFFGCEGG